MQRPSTTACRPPRRRTCSGSPRTSSPHAEPATTAAEPALQADNRRRRTAELEQFIIEQQQEIARLAERLAYYENGGGPERQRAEPRIY
jgi:hypothetical protein